MRAATRRIWGMLFRHLALYRRSWPRLLELAYWPTLQMVVWGLTARFFAARLGTGGPSGALLAASSVLIGGVLLWEIALRSQVGVAMSFLEEIWSRNLAHVFVSPLRPAELVATLFTVSLLRTLVGLAPAAILAWLLYAFNVFAMGPILVLFAANLLVMGWALSLAVVSLILRYGAGAEALAWTLLFGFTPFCCVFYPVATLPAALQPLALALPATHVFEGMRAALEHGVVAWGHLGWAVGLNLAWIGAAGLIFAWQFRAARVRGALLSIGE